MNKILINSRIGVVLLIMCMLISLIVVPSVSANDPEIIPNDDNIDFTVGMYDDADRTNLCCELTADGATLKDWEYMNSFEKSEDKYLGFNIKNIPSDGSLYQIVVEMAPYIYINVNSDPVIDKTTMTYTKNKNITVNTDGSYSPHKYSVSELIYTIDQNTSSLAFGLPVCFDINLWNKLDGGELGDGVDPLIKVYVKKLDNNIEKIIEGTIKSLFQATTSGSVPFTGSTNSFITSAGSGASSTNKMGPDDEMSLNMNLFSNTIFTGGHYARTVEVKIKIPQCVVNDKTYTLGYRNFFFNTSAGSALVDTSYDEETGILTVKGENLFFKNYKAFEIVFSPPDELKSIPGTYVFKGSIDMYCNGAVVTSNNTINLILDTNKEAIVKPFATAGKANIIELDTVQPLGNLALQNDAAAFENGSGNLLVCLDFDSNNTRAVAVTTVNLMVDRDAKTINIKYSLVDRDGNPAYLNSETGENQVFTTSINNKYYSPGGTISTGHYITFPREQLSVPEHREYYFDTFSYTIGNIPGNTKAYHYGAFIAPYSAGTFWGNITIDEIPKVKPVHSMDVYSIDSDGNILENVVSKTVSTNIDAGTKVPYGLESASVSSNTVNAGDSVTVKGKVFVASYPYTSNNCLNDIKIGAIVPNGVSINASDIIATYTGGVLPVKKISVKTINAQNNLYLIEFEQGNKIGYYNESLSALSTGSTLNLTIVLNNEKVMSTQTISLRENIFVAGDKRENGSGGTYADHSVVDIYDLNANDSTTDKIGSFGAETTQSITFQANTAALVITDSLVKNDETERNSSIENFAEHINYRLDLECAQTGTASDFYYIIPVAKSTMTKEIDFVTKCDTDLELKGEVKVDTIKGTGMRVLYAFDKASSYNEAVNITSWYETLPSGKTWKDVTFLKVVSIEEIIVSESHNIVNIPLGYSGIDIDYMNKAGSEIIFCSKGYYAYTIGANSSAGIYATKGCMITMEYKDDLEQFTLTAAKEGKPKGEGSSSSYSFLLPESVGSQSFVLKQIKEHNLILVSDDYDFTTADSTQSNENFRIKVWIENTDSSGSISDKVVLSNEDTVIGNIPGNITPKITFTIENSDWITDAVSERSVSMILVGDNGLILPIVIDVQRELATAKPTVSAITEGKIYAPIEGQKQVTVSANSAFTAQFVTEYVPTNYSDRTITFEHALSAGTTVTMVDWTDSSQLKFYHYTLDNNEESIALEDFDCMGSSNDYIEPSETSLITERLLFIVAFPTEGEPVRDNKITLTKKIKLGIDDQQDASLSFTTVPKRKFSLSSSKENIFFDESFILSYKTECSVSDSYFAGRTLALVIKDKEGILSKDTALKANDMSYNLNSQGIFIVPIESAQIEKGKIEVSLDSSVNIETDIQIELWASATSNGDSPMMGEKVAGPVDVSISKCTMPSFKVLGMNDRILSADALTDSVTVDFMSLNADNLTVEVKKKTGNDYVTQTNMITSVNGDTSADISPGVFSVTNNGSVDLVFNEESESGTYRLQFTVINKHGHIQVPYNFIII